jgi:hypothetical protein
VEGVEERPRPLAGAHPRHRRQIPLPPGVGERPGVESDAPLRSDLGNLLRDPGAPVDRGPEDVERQHLHRVSQILHLDLPSRFNVD